VCALARRTISASYRPFLGDAAVDAFLGSGAADQYVREHLARCRLLLRGGVIMGFCVCNANLIDLLMIDQPYHRQGLSSVLLADVEASLFQRYRELRLESFAGNVPANTFYHKHGWRAVDRYLDTDSGSEKIRFCKTAG
jgi:GNAT superfamily N-acetyltransferase